MAQPSKTSQSAPERVQKHFQEQASSFDELYGTDTNEEAPLQRTLRPGLFRRRELAVSVVRSYDKPRVLDVGCGSGRIGEFVLEAGAGEYVGNDFSRPMLDLAEKRLERYGDKVRFVEGDFLDAELGGPYEVVIGLGLFDYLPDPERFARRMYELTRRGRDGRRQLPQVDVGEGAGPEGPLRVDQQLPDLQLHRARAPADVRRVRLPGGRRAEAGARRVPPQGRSVSRSPPSVVTPVC